MAFAEVMNKIGEIEKTLDARGHTSNEAFPQWRIFLSVCIMGKMVFEDNHQEMNKRAEDLIANALTYLPNAQQEIEEVCPNISKKLFFELKNELHYLAQSRVS